MTFRVRTDLITHQICLQQERLVGISTKPAAAKFGVSGGSLPLKAAAAAAGAHALPSIKASPSTEEPRLEPGVPQR